MPRSRSRSVLSIARSATRSLARKMPLWWSMRVDQGGLAVVDVGDDGDVAPQRVGDGRGGFLVRRHLTSIQSFMPRDLKNYGRIGIGTKGSKMA